MRHARPHPRRAAGAGAAHDPVRSRRQPDRHRLRRRSDDGATNSLWWATRNEWLKLLDIAGLELEALYAGFAREPFADDSQEYVFLARRPTCRL